MLRYIPSNLFFILIKVFIMEKMLIFFEKSVYLLYNVTFKSTIKEGNTNEH